MQERFEIRLDVATGIAATDFVEKIDEQIAELEKQLVLLKGVRDTVTNSFDIGPLGGSRSEEQLAERKVPLMRDIKLGAGKAA